MGLRLGGSCWGMAFHVRARDARAALTALWEREMLNRVYFPRMLAVRIGRPVRRPSDEKMAIRRTVGGATRERSIRVPGLTVWGFFMPAAVQFVADAVIAPRTRTT